MGNMASGSEKRVWCCAKFGEILLIGEKLRVEMHSMDNPQLIRDRRYFMKSYTSCFVGSETVDWLCKSNQLPNRDMAVFVMNILIDNQILHAAVMGSGPFRDDNSLYRFRKDDSSYPWVDDLSVFMKGKRLHEKVCADMPYIIKHQTESGQMFKKSFLGRALVDWMITHREAYNREDAVDDGRLLLQNDVIRHVTDKQHFKDEALLYQFKIDYNRELTLLDLVIPPELGSDEEQADEARQETNGNGKDGMDGGDMSRLRRISNSLSQGKNVPSRSESGYHSDLHDSPTSPSSSFTKHTSASSLEDKLMHDISSLKVDSPSGILTRKVTADELLAENSQFTKRNVRVAQDPVGYGIVLRGEGPVYVKAVDPMGPAAAAGLKVGHYIYSINDEVVLPLNYRELAHRVVDCNGYMNMVVYEYTHDQPVS